MYNCTLLKWSQNDVLCFTIVSFAIDFYRNTSFSVLFFYNANNFLCIKNIEKTNKQRVHSAKDKFVDIKNAKVQVKSNVKMC